MTATQASAIAAAAQVLAAVRGEREDIARSGGPEAVGQWAAAPGEDPAGTADHYRRLQAQARKATAA